MLQRTLLRATQCAARTATAPAPRWHAMAATRVAAPAATTSTPARRWYADAAPAKDKAEPAETPADDSASPAPPAEDSAAAQLAKKDAEIIALKDKYLRSVADFRNLQERTARETKAAKDFAIQRFARDLVESVDNLDRALGTVAADKLTADNADLLALHDGIKMTDTILLNTLKKHGLERFDPSDTGDKFDPNVHEAVFQAPQPDKEDGSCFHTQQKGFKLNGRVLRPAKVGVVKNA